MRSLKVAALLVPILATGAAAQGSGAQRAACTPDVFRLCSSEIPNVSRITACLRRERPSLSSACGSVFDALDRQASTRSLTAPVASGPETGAWCAFGDRPIPGQDVWIAWCDEMDRR